MSRFRLWFVCLLVGLMIGSLRGEDAVTQVSGRVTAEDPRLLRGLELIFFTRNTRHRATIAEDGTFDCGVTGEGNAGVRACRDEVELSLPYHVSLDPGEARTLDVHLKRGRRLQVQVRSGPGGRPVPQAKITLARYPKDAEQQGDWVWGSTDLEGNFRCDGLIQGMYSLEVIDPGGVRHAHLIDPGPEPVSIELQKRGQLELILHPHEWNRIRNRSRVVVKFLRNVQDDTPRLPVSYWEAVEFSPERRAVLPLPPEGKWSVRIGELDSVKLHVEDAREDQRLQIGMAPGALSRVTFELRDASWSPVTTGSVRVGPVESALGERGQVNVSVLPGSHPVDYTFTRDGTSFHYWLGTAPVPRAPEVSRSVKLGKLSVEVGWKSPPGTGKLTVKIRPKAVDGADDLFGGDNDHELSSRHLEFGGVRVEAPAIRDLVIPHLPSTPVIIDVYIDDSFFDRRELPLSPWAQSHGFTLEYRQPARWVFDVDLPDGVDPPPYIRVFPVPQGRRPPSGYLRIDNDVPVVEGRAELSVFRPGAHRIGIRAPGFKPRMCGVVSVLGEEVRIPVQLEPDASREP